MMVLNRNAGVEWRLTLARQPRAPGEARRFVAGVLADRAPNETVHNALLVASELITNAYQHGNGEIELSVRLLADRVRLEVIDEGRDQAPAVREQQPDGSGGWGLRIVDQLAVEWGVFEGTTHVWADLALA